MSNPIEQLLVARQVALPATALDLSEALRDASITRPYIIVMTGRCGSTWLASALSKVPGYGNPIEYYSEEGLRYYWEYETPQSFADVFLGIAQKYSDDGKFGFKINPQRLFWLNQYVDLPKTFPPNRAAWIDMRRWNLVKQALSFVIAKKTGSWHRYKGGKKEDNQQGRIEINDMDIWCDLLAIVDQEQKMDKFYAMNGVMPLRIWYEELSDSKPSLILRVLKFIDPDVQENNLELDGDTERNDHGAMADIELDFVRKYSAILNEVYSNRNSIDVNLIKNGFLV